MKLKHLKVVSIKPAQSQEVLDFQAKVDIVSSATFPLIGIRVDVFGLKRN